MTRTLLTTLMLLTGCPHTESQPESLTAVPPGEQVAETPADSPPAAELSAPQPADSVPATEVSAPPPAEEACVTLWTTLDGAQSLEVARNSSVHFRAHARNDTEALVTLVLPNRCPQIPVDFTGFPGQFLPDDSCMAGECAAQPPHVFELQPGQTLVLTEVSAPVGDATTCSADIAAGTYEIGFSLWPTDKSTAQLCPVQTARLVVF